MEIIARLIREQEALIGNLQRLRASSVRMEKYIISDHFRAEFKEAFVRAQKIRDQLQPLYPRVNLDPNLLTGEMHIAPEQKEKAAQIFTFAVRVVDMLADIEKNHMQTGPMLPDLKVTVQYANDAAKDLDEGLKKIIRHGEIIPEDVENG